MSDLTSKDYWNDRAEKTRKDGLMGVYNHSKVLEHDSIVRKVIQSYKNDSVLEIACGYGRFANEFQDYLGIDFSDVMIQRAQENHPGKQFRVENARTFKPEKQYDVIFQVISRTSLKQSPEEFYEQWKPYARKFIIYFELEMFVAFPIYANMPDKT
jgi:SAM-dependent methyltransferase